MSDKATRKRTDFIIRIVGKGVRPWAVPFRSLARVLEAVQRLVDQRDDESDAGLAEPDEPTKADEIRTLHLVDVKSSSAAYEVAAPNSALAHEVLTGFGRSIKSPDNVEWSTSALSSLKELSEVAKSLGCEIEFREPKKTGQRSYGNVIAKITPKTYEGVASIAYISGRTSVYAKIERVGGATEMHCGIRLPHSPRKMVICRVANESLVRKLGQLIYQNVVLSGRAKWLRHNWKLKQLIIDDFERAKTGSIFDTLKKAHDKGGAAWDDIEDPDAFIGEMRAT